MLKLLVQLVEPERAGLPLIDFHDVRHCYATAGRDAKIDWKALSQRNGHADVAFAMRQHVQSDLEGDRQVASVSGRNGASRLPAGASITARTVRSAPATSPPYTGALRA